jgi:hypothetical protein
MTSSDSIAAQRDASRGHCRRVVNWYRAFMSSDSSANRDHAQSIARIARDGARVRVRDTHRSFQEFVTLVDSRYAYSLPYSAAPNLRLPFDTWERETKTLVDVRRLWEYAIDLDTGVRHEMEWFTPVWQKMWPGIARHQLAAIDERTNRESVNLVWVLIDEKSAELTKKCLAEASISGVDVISIEEWLSRKGRTGETVPVIG